MNLTKFISFVICIILFNPGTDSKFVPPPNYTLNLSLPATEISMERIVLLNLLYDIHAYDHREEMSTISVAFRSDYDISNPIVTGGTFGWVYTPLLRDMIIVVGTPIPAQYIIRGATFAGMVGLQAGVVASEFSAMYAERKANRNETWKVIFDNLRTGNYITLPLQIRYKLQYDPLDKVFIDNVVDFSNSRLLSPSYLILGGSGLADPNQGALMTRDCNTANDTVFLGSPGASWFVIGTNIAPWIVNPHDPQKTLLSNELKKAGTDTDIAGLLRILQNPKFYNNHSAFVTATTACFWGPYTTLIYYPD